MRFIEVGLPGVYVIDLEPIADERGFFARTWCRDEFAKHSLVSELVQCNVSFNAKQGTLRGMHYQAEPHGEVKLVRCTMGAIFDVLVDVRPDSATLGKWQGFRLTAQNRRMLYVPVGIAHGFQTLTDAAEVFYQMSTPYVATAAQGVRWDDPAFGIAWPEAVTVISPKDQSYQDFRP